jgi:hypothetical protein
MRQRRSETVGDGESACKPDRVTTTLSPASDRRRPPPTWEWVMSSPAGSRLVTVCAAP